MSDPLPRRLRRTAMPLVPPPPQVPQNRVVIGANTIRAGFDAHKGDEHAGAIGRDCRTCRRYGAALAVARGEACDPAAGRHVDPHRGCVLR